MTTLASALEERPMADAPVLSFVPGPLHTRTEHVWGTVVGLLVRDAHATPDTVDAAWESVRAELHRVDAVFSTYRDDSVVSRLRARSEEHTSELQSH